MLRCPREPDAHTVGQKSDSVNLRFELGDKE